MKSRNVSSLGPAAASVFLALFLAACTVGPNYRRPSVNPPASFYNAPQPASTQIPLGDQKWWDLFHDQQLQALINAGLRQNYDVQIAASRITQAQAQVGLTRSNQFPALNAEVAVQTEKLPIFSFNIFQILGAFSWNPDFWGQ